MFLIVAKSTVHAYRQLMVSRRVFFLLVVVFGFLLASIYSFVRVREATIPQLVSTSSLMLVIPALFFFLQALSINYVSSDGSSVIRRSAYQCWKLAAVTIPATALVIGIWFLLNKLQTHFGVGPGAGDFMVRRNKLLTILTAVRFALIGVVGPLMLIRLWVASSQAGLLSMIRSSRQLLASAFISESVLTYVMGSIAFLAIPYLLINKPVSTTKPWLELTVLGLRLSISALLIVVGWSATVGALTLAYKRRAADLEQSS